LRYVKEIVLNFSIGKLKKKNSFEVGMVRSDLPRGKKGSKGREREGVGTRQMVTYTVLYQLWNIVDSM